MKFLALVSLVATLGTQSFAQTCGNLCSPEFWNTATTQEIATAIDSVDVNARTEDGVTPLHIAAAFGTPENIAALVEAGADVNAKDQLDRTPLHFLAATGLVENIRLLLEVVITNLRFERFDKFLYWKSISNFAQQSCTFL